MNREPNYNKPYHIEHLSGKVVKGGVWIFVLRILSRTFDFFGTLILARFLLPSDFGIIGIVGITISITYAFTSTGIQQALVQKKGNISTYLNTAWTIQTLRGSILTALLYAIAPFVATLFNSPQITTVLRINAVTIFLGGLVNIGYVHFQKDLQFNRIVYLDAGTALAKLAVSIPLAIYLQNFWAIVWGNLAGAFVKMIISYIIHPFRPRFDFNIQRAKELFSYGKWIMGTSIIWFLVLEGDDLFVGKLLGLSMLGFYQMAYKISNIPATEISHVISKVTFPAFAMLQDDSERLKYAFLDVFQLVAIVLFPITGGIFVLSDSFTLLFLGSKWLPMIPALKVLVFAGLLRALSVTAGPIFMGTGKPIIDAKWQTIRLVILIVTIGPMTLLYGLPGAAGSVLISVLATTVLSLRSLINLITIKSKDIFKIMATALLNTAVMAIIIICLGVNSDIMTQYKFVSLIFVGVVAYIVMVIISDRLFKSNSYDLIRRVIIAGVK